MSEANHYTELGNKHHEFAKLYFKLAEKTRDADEAKWARDMMLQVVEQGKEEEDRYNRVFDLLLEPDIAVFENLIWACEDQAGNEEGMDHWHEAKLFIATLLSVRHEIIKQKEEFEEELAQSLQDTE